MIKNISCPYCEKLYSKMGIKSHIWRTHGDGVNHSPNRGHSHISWNKGLTKETNEKVKQYANSLIGKVTGIGSTLKKENERKEKLSLAIIKRYKEGWDSKCGRAKKYDYESPVAGKIKVDGTWELNTAIYLDKIGVKWERNTKRFSYTNLIGAASTYRPDFYIYDWNSYLEIKGYETKLDKCKWEQFKEHLIIWKKIDLKKLNII